MNTWNYSIDKFLNRMPSKTYNCLDFVREAWLDMTGDDISERLPGLTVAFAERRGSADRVKGFQRLEQPSNPCIAVFQRKNTTPHMGIYLNGRILHLHGNGVEFQPLVVARQYFRRVAYYV